jgi:hypothetical protein
MTSCRELSILALDFWNDILARSRKPEKSKLLKDLEALRKRLKAEKIAYDSSFEPRDSRNNFNTWTWQEWRGQRVSVLLIRGPKGMKGPMKEINTKIPCVGHAKDLDLWFGEYLKKLRAAEDRKAAALEFRRRLKRPPQAEPVQEPSAPLPSAERGWPLLLSEAQAAAYIGIPIDLFRALLAAGKLPKAKSVGGMRLYVRDALAAALSKLGDEADI